jgi:hypothetical protein
MPFTAFPGRPQRLLSLSLLLLAILLPGFRANASEITVTLSTDSNAGTAGTGPGNSGDLRYSILAANLAGGANTILFLCGNPCTITLNGPLPPITSNLTIDGGQFGDVVIDGNNLYRVFFVDTGTVALSNLRIRNASATGGAGGNGYSAGGGGAGFGAGLFVNKATAVVTVSNTYFHNCNVTGGNGGNANSDPNSGGGGGMGFAGGAGSGTGSGGGGGITGAGGVGSGTLTGGAGGSGGGGGGFGYDHGGTKGSAYANSSAGAAGSGGDNGAGGNGGFGGGGGGGFGGYGPGASGGFGGGGGGWGYPPVGPGGFGGGGGSSPPGGGGPGVSAGAVGAVQGGTAGATGSTGAGGGGGGSGAGPAIFVNQGSLTLYNTTGATFSSTQGQGGTGTGGGASGSAASSPDVGLLNNLPGNSQYLNEMQSNQAYAVGFTMNETTTFNSAMVTLNATNTSEVLPSGLTASIYNNSAGVPGSVIDSLHLSGDPASFSIGTAVYSLLSTAPLTLTSGTTYWLVLEYSLSTPLQWVSSVASQRYSTSGATFVSTQYADPLGSGWSEPVAYSSEIYPDLEIVALESAPVFNYAGTVNGSTANGQLGAALPGGLPATQLRFTVPQPLAPGASTTLDISALDQNGNPATGYNGKVTLTSDDSADFPTDPLQFEAGSGSEAGFEVPVGSVSNTVTATDTLWPYITGTSSNFDVLPIAQTITFMPIIGSYAVGDGIALSATATSGLAVRFVSTTPSVCTVSGTTVSLIGGGSCAIEAQQWGNSIYGVAPFAFQTVWVYHSSQTIAFGPILAQTALTTTPLSATATSGLAVTFASLTPATCSVTHTSGWAASPNDYGTCTIQASQTGSSIYSPAAHIVQSFLVHHATQTIDFSAIAFNQNADSTLPLSATATSGLTVTFASLSPATCTVSGTTAALNAYGFCTIQASQAGNGTYGEAAHAVQTFFIHHLNQSITFGTISSQAEGAPLTLSATSSSGLAVGFSSLTTGVCTVSGSTATLSASGTCTIEAAQPGNTVYGVAPQVKRSFTVNP